MAHPYKGSADRSRAAKVKRFADGGGTDAGENFPGGMKDPIRPTKDQSRYGAAAADVSDNSRPNEWRARMLLGPPRTKNTPGFGTETSSTRQKRRG